ncbi:tryptophan synthase subunit alpha [Alicyclobacillus cycloheptanicus]|uniref:Tryptophan synthase alpha chain n=1 Tax=Alicyclobacillus cycloheptanicus TaxID=1457 RepID=A0ABT9XE30_9BACL|nr:tryptophan synthase subunit alpha [Alicyclobacillus cycloheptanicus]MDQ0188549.1 tryptophan synthase alpha chain [Alicyclobacillus cycloheptanicus]WDM01234.1 tryptophan synthase subunit alpha [Alicyclobacillus cycloheptanicus]
MSRIAKAFEQKTGRAALIPFLNTGDPSMDLSLRLMEAVLETGADVLEIGMPYSDPLADGPVIQASAVRSLQAGFALPKAFEAAAHLRTRTDKGLVLFTYVNPLLQYTPERFFRDAVQAGADGVIVPDLPFEESDGVREAADAAGIDLIPLIAPTSGEARIAQICQAARGFVYCVSSLGVTGERARMSDRVEALVQTARRYTSLPVAVGFGVSGPDQAKAIAAYADGVIVGSAFIRRIDQVLQAAPQALAAPGAGEVAARARTEELANDVLGSVRSFAAELMQAIR